MKQGLLYSQIGYDIGDPMKACFCADTENALRDAYFEVVYLDTGEKKSAKPECFGEKWKRWWWELDFSGIKRPCEIIIKLYSGGDEIEHSDPIPVGYNLVWDRTIKEVAISAFEERQKRARNGIGWKDCGSEFREICSIAPSVSALCDLLNKCPAEFSGQEQERIRRQIIAGAEYIMKCMEAAECFGMPRGAIVHDIPNFIVNLPGDTAQAVIALAKASVLLVENDSSKSSVYLEAAKAGYEHILHGLQPYGEEGLNRELLDIPAGTALPGEFMTKDLFLFLEAGISLYKAGQFGYKDSVIRFADEIMARQVPEEEKEDGLYGHFYTFDSLKISEKNFIHHHCGHDCGGIFFNYLRPFMDLILTFSSHEKVKLWEEVIQRYTVSFFIPACQRNPFRLLPVGYYKGEGWLNFCGPWHGFNTMMGYTASLALELIKFVPRQELYEIAISNIQWFCGVNAGLCKESFDTCVFWQEDIPEGKVVPFSQIMGIGRRSVSCWTDIVGTIPNGFCVNSQFQFDVPNKLENDGPVRYTDEDWIPHSAGFICALAELNDRHYFDKVHPRSRKLLDFMHKKELPGGSF